MAFSHHPPAPPAPTAPWGGPRDVPYADRYPPVRPADAQFAPPGAPAGQGPGGANVPGTMTVALPKLETQPWIKDLVAWFKTNTTGVARVDLRRPMPPSLDQYQDSLFFASYKSPVSGIAPTSNQPTTLRHVIGPAGRPQPAPPAPPPQGYRAAPQQQQFLQSDAQSPAYAPVPGKAAHAGPPTGARVKITRRFLLWCQDDDKSRPLVDIGAGVNIDMDRQRVEPVLRAKLAGLMSIKAAPSGLLKVSKTMRIGTTGMGVKLRYEVPLEQLHNFYRPPARLMLRLEQVPGSGIHLTPSGLELDQRVVRFGSNVSMRASLGLAFPRTLPFDPESDDVGLKVHRLSLKALW